MLPPEGLTRMEGRMKEYEGKEGLEKEATQRKGGRTIKERRKEGRKAK